MSILFCSCQRTVVTDIPEISLDSLKTTGTTATFYVSMQNSDNYRYSILLRDSNEKVSEGEYLFSESKFIVSDLLPETEYIVELQSYNSYSESHYVRKAFFTEQVGRPEVRLGQFIQNENNVTLVFDAENSLSVRYCLDSSGNCSDYAECAPDDPVSLTDLECGMSHCIYYYAVGEDGEKTDLYEHHFYVAGDSDIVLSVDRTDVEVGDKITFNVSYKGDDMTDDAIIVNITSSDTVKCNSDFLMDRSGINNYKAIYGGYSSNVLEISSTGYFDPETDYYKCVQAMKFTATWCGNCPEMTENLDLLKKEFPGRINVCAMHNDEFEIPELIVYANEFGLEFLPSISIDFLPLLNNDIDKIRACISEQLSLDGAAGISMESMLFDDESIGVKSQIRITRDGNYRIGCLLMENNIIVSETQGYRAEEYDNVVRAFFTDPLGNEIGECVKGQQLDFEFNLNQLKGYEASNCEVMIFVLRMDSLSGKYYVNNTAVAGLGEKKDYVFE